jgi:UDP-glucose 4-epimerase
LVKTAVSAGELKSATILRVCATVGPGLTHGIIKDFIRKIKENDTLEILGGAPGSMKPFLHVSDLVNAVKFSIDKQPNDTFNVCSEDTITCATVAKAVMEGVEQEKPIQFLGEGANWKGDNRKIHCSAGKLVARGWDRLYDNAYDSILGAVNEIHYIDENI